MAIEYIDGFDDYSTSQVLRYATNGWSAAASTGTISQVSILTSSGRNSSGCFHTTNSNVGLFWTFTSQATRTIGFAYKAASIPASTIMICAFMDAGTTQLTVRLNSDGTLSVVRGQVGGTVLSTSSLTISGATWYYIEFQATINNTTGSYTLKVNGITYTSGSGVNTRNSANNSANQVALSGNDAVGIAEDYDDFYVDNSSTFHGDCRVETKLPTGDGATTNFTPSTGVNHYALVDENPANDDTDYNSSATDGHIDLYTYPALATGSGDIKAVMTVPVERNDAAGTVTTQSVYRSGGTNYFGDSKNISSTTYAPYPDIKETNPDTGVAWTITEVNNTQFGLKIVA